MSTDPTEPAQPGPEPESERTARRDRIITWTGAIAAAISAAVILLILLWDWNMLRGPISRAASDRLGREVTIAGDLDVKVFSWRPTATAETIRIEDPEWAGEGRTAEIERILVQIRLLPLFLGRYDLTRLEFRSPDVRLFRNAEGRATWDFSKPGERGEPLRLPPIRRFVIEDGRLRLTDEGRGLTFAGSIEAQERRGTDDPGFRLEGEGELNQAPFLLRVTGGPLINIERDKPYPFDAEVRAGDTRVTAVGSVPRPFDLGRLEMDLTAQGPDLADLYDLTGLAFPNTPPYQLRGRLTRDNRLWTIGGLSGDVGDSDLAGELSVDAAPERPFLRAELSTRNLDFDDLAAIFGGAPSTAPGETASDTQKAVARTLASQQRLFPNAPLRVERLRAMDADVTYEAASIRDAPAALRAASVRVRLDDGMLTADPARLSLPQGELNGTVRLNARGQTPVTDLDVRLTGARLEQFIPARNGEQPLRGVLVGRARLTGQGDSVRRAFANADGEVLLVVPDGQIRRAFAELLGINVVRGLGLLLSEDQEQTPIRCAVAHFEARDGVMHAGQIVFDTGPVLGEGSGTVNLGSERMSLRLEGKAKEPRLVRLIAPVTVEGPIRSPQLGVEAGEAIAQGGLAAALAALATPLAAILPFVDPGLAEDANCGALVAGAGREGAPVGSGDGGGGD